MVELNQLEIISGFSSLVQILISFVLGSIMIYNYFRYKDRNLLFMGISIILVTEAWWPYTFSLILILTTGENLPLGLYILIGLVLIPITIILWMVVNANLMWQKKRKLVISLSTIFAVIYEIIILYAAFIDPTNFAILEGPLDVRYISLLLLFQIIILFIILISVIWFFKESRKSVEPKIRLKGTLYLISGLSFAIAASLDAILPLSLILLLIVRILLTLAAFELYCSFIMPEWMKKILLRKK